jgi:hypothetical protein
LLISKGVYSKTIIPIFNQYNFNPQENNTFYICYFGSFNRFENVDAVNYYLKTIHEELIDKIKNYKYMIIGIDAEKHFFADKYTEVYGFQEDPSYLLNKCAASVVLLRYGSGIKIKVLQLLSLGITCFSTGVGSEGIESVKGLVTSDNVDELVESVCVFYRHGNLKKDEVRNEFLKKYNQNLNFEILNQIFSIK